MIHLLNRLSAISHITKTLSIPSIVQFCHRSGIHCSGARSAMDVPSVVNVLESIAPLNVAEDWDNVGLLVQPSTSALINHIFLTIDLTEPVLQLLLILQLISSEESSSSQRSLQVKLHTKKNLLKNLLPELIQDFPNYKLSLTSLPKVPMPGPDGLLMLNESVPFHKVISQIKNHLKLDHIRVALLTT
jgi:hypothetical protein